MNQTASKYEWKCSPNWSLALFLYGTKGIFLEANFLGFFYSTHSLLGLHFLIAILQRLHVVCLFVFTESLYNDPVLRFLLKNKCSLLFYCFI